VTAPLPDDRVRVLRARSQRLLDERLEDPAALVRELVGVQAQEPAAAAWSIGVRTRGVTAAAVERAIVEERSVVRVPAMRGTLHLVPAEDAAWIVELFAPAAMAASHRRLGQLGVPEADRPRAVEAIVAALGTHGPLTRAELMEHVAAVGVRTDGQAAAHLPQLAALQGLVCFGPPRAGKPTYALRDDWLGPNLPRLPRERALAELALRYVRAYGPAAPEDLAAWSGLPLRDARAAWPEPLPAVEAIPAPDPPIVRLLPAFDTYLLGYRTRDLAVPRAGAREVWPGGGIVRPTVIANGLAVGTWRRARGGVEVEPFAGAAIDEASLASAVADVQDFVSGGAPTDGEQGPPHGGPAPARPAPARSSPG
jgi:hypothetical protein